MQDLVRHGWPCGQAGVWLLWAYDWSGTRTVGGHKTEVHWGHTQERLTWCLDYPFFKALTCFIAPDKS